MYCVVQVKGRRQEECDLPFNPTLAEQEAACSRDTDTASTDTVCAEEAVGGDDVCCDDYDTGSNTISTYAPFNGDATVVPTGATGGKWTGYPYFYIELPTVELLEDGSTKALACPTEEDGVAVYGCKAYCYDTCDQDWCPDSGYDCSLTYKRDYDIYECKANSPVFVGGRRK